MDRPATRDLSTEELFRLYAPFVARFLYRLGVRSEGLDDLVQEVFLVAHRNGGYRAGPAKPTSYLATIAHNAALAHRRKARSQRSRHAEVDVEELFSKGRSPVQVLEASDSLRLLQAALERLDAPLRTTLILVEIEGESCTSVASAMGVPVGTVYFRLHQARKKFQAALKVVEAGRLRVVPRSSPPSVDSHEEPARRAKVGMAFGANLLWQQSGAHDLLRLGYEQPPISYETLAGLERHRQLATAGLPLPDWATAGAPGAGAGAAIGLAAAGVAAVGAALAAALWLPSSVNGAVKEHGASTPSQSAVAAAVPQAAPAAQAAKVSPSLPVPATALAPPRESALVAAPPAQAERAEALPAAGDSTTEATGRTTTSPPAAVGARVEAPSGVVRQPPRPTSQQETEPVSREQPAEPTAVLAEAPAPAPDDARLESLQIAQAERLLASDPARALAAARSAAVRFPAGFLREERAYVEIAALSKLGRTEEARAAGARFLRAYPRGAFAARVSKAIEP